MILYLLQGYLLGLAYVAPIGTQNLYVIQTALQSKTKRALQTALITSFFDISLAFLCFFGIGTLIKQNLYLKECMLLLGFFIVSYIGITLVFKSANQIEGQIKNVTLKQTLFTAFSVTFFNPQAIIDGSLLLGGYHAILPNQMALPFILGVMLASLSWFHGIASITSIFHTKFNPKIIKIINILCGIILCFYGLRLGLQFYILIR